MKHVQDRYRRTFPELMRSLYQDLTESAAISTTPQRERSDAHKVPRGLREHILDFHKAWRAPRIMNIENVKNDVLPWSQQLFCRGLQCIVPAMKNEPEASEVLHLPHGIIIMSKIKNDDSFTKRGRPFQSVLQVRQILRLPRKMTPKSISHFDPHLPMFYVQKVPCVPHGWKSVCCPAPKRH